MYINEAENVRQCLLSRKLKLLAIAQTTFLCLFTLPDLIYNNKFSDDPFMDVWGHHISEERKVNSQLPVLFTDFTWG